jgi:hypothetical protein
MFSNPKFGSEYAKKACEDNKYPYLYWGGNVANKYPDVHEGFVIKRTELKSFIEKTLTGAGFNKKERNDFIEYWVPQMLRKDGEYFRISFMTTGVLNTFIPMKVTPKPDSIYRIFMDWEPLTKVPSQALFPQVLPKIKRDGFTLIEWGGVHPR